MAVTKNSGIYWEGNCDREPVQRIYRISFPHKKAIDGVEAVPGSGGQARPLHDWDAAGPLLLPRPQPRLGLLQAHGCPHLQKAADHSEGLLGVGLPVGDRPQYLQRQTDQEGGLWAEANDMLGPLPDV